MFALSNNSTIMDNKKSKEVEEGLRPIFMPFGESYENGLQHSLALSEQKLEAFYRAARDEREHQKLLSQFPEQRGPELQFGVDPSGVIPTAGLFEAYQPGILERIRGLHKKMEGGVEPPSIVTAKDMADELESLPRSLVDAALDPLDTGETEKILEELKRQGDEVAVELTRKEEFDYLNLMNMQKEMGIQLVDPYLPIIFHETPRKNEDYLSETSMMFRDPSIASLWM